MVDSAWQSFAKSIGRESLPRLTDSASRKLAVTTHRESGASREEQEALASHMTHSVNTADRYYNKAFRKEERGKAIAKITSTYRAKARDMAESGKEVGMPPP